MTGETNGNEKKWIKVTDVAGFFPYDSKNSTAFLKKKKMRFACELSKFFFCFFVCSPTASYHFVLLCSIFVFGLIYVYILHKTKTQSYIITLYFVLLSLIVRVRVVFCFCFLLFHFINLRKFKSLPLLANYDYFIFKQFSLHHRNFYVCFFFSSFFCVYVCVCVVWVEGVYLYLYVVNVKC